MHFNVDGHWKQRNKPSEARVIGQHTWKLESCSIDKLPLKVETVTALLSSCSFITQARALFLPTSSSEKKKLPDKSHSSTFPSSCKVIDLTPARTRFFAARTKVHVMMSTPLAICTAHKYRLGSQMINWLMQAFMITHISVDKFNLPLYVPKSNNLASYWNKVHLKENVVWLMASSKSWSNWKSLTWYSSISLPFNLLINEFEET